MIVASVFLALLVLAAPAALAASTCDNLQGHPGDLDGDGFTGALLGGGDCDDSEAGLWSTPGPVLDLVEITGAPGGAAHTFEWTDITSSDPGATAGLAYDALRSENASDFRDPTALCLEPSGTDLRFSDTAVPAPGQVLFYQVRANNACGHGSLGTGFSAGVPLPRAGLSCDCSVLCDDGNACTVDTCSNGACSTTVVDPSIHRPPIDAASCDGGDVVLDVEATGNGSLTYEWFKNGAPVGMNLPILMLTQVTPGDDGTAITVRVSDTCGSTTSSPAALTVYTDPASCSGGLDGQGPPNARGHTFGADQFKNHRSRCDDDSSDSRTETARGHKNPDCILADVKVNGPPMTRSHDDDDSSSSGVHGRNPTPTRVMALDSGKIMRAGGGDDSDSETIELLPQYSPDVLGGFHGGGDDSDSDTYRSHTRPHLEVTKNAARLIGMATDEDSDSMMPELRYAGGVLHHSGEYLYRAMDVFIPGRGYDFTFGRTYRSREERNGRMGFQWVDNQDRRLEWENPATPVNLRLHDGSSARNDLYTPDAVGCYESTGFFRHLCPDPTPGGGFILTFADKRRWFFRPLDGSPVAGRIDRVEDRNGNTQVYTYDPGSGRLLSITDTLSRVISFSYDANSRITAVTDFSGRVWSYTYSAAGDLVSMTTPAVTGTPTGNDFPAGKTTTYSYSEGQLLGELNHNLQTVTDPAGETFLRVVYTQAVSPSDPRFDRTERLLLYDEDLPTESDSITYVFVTETPSASNNFAVSKTIVKDRAGNVSESYFDVQSRCVLRRRYTGRAPAPGLPVGQVSNRPVNPLRPTDPPFFDTLISFNADSLITQVTHPNNNQVQVTYDSAHSNVRMRGNFLRLRALPGPLGAAQALHDYLWSYTTDFGTEYCNGLDGECDGRDKTRVQGGLAFEAVEIAHEGLKMQGLAGGGGGAGGGRGWPLRGYWSSYTDPDSNTFSLTYDPSGNLQRIDAPPVTQRAGLPPQTVAWRWSHNSFGQVTQHINPAGRVDTVSYYTTGTQTGYPETLTVDSTGFVLTRTLGYDVVGNVVSITDPKGAATTVVRNALNQVVRVVSRSPFAYETDVYYNASDRVVRMDVRDDVGLSSLPQPYVSTLYAYNRLHRLKRARQEIDEASQACVVTEYDHDANGLLAEVRLGEATNGNQPHNTVAYTYDERNLLFGQEHAGGDAVQVNDQLAYDGNRNVIRAAQGLQHPAGPNEDIFTYDGYDRLLTATDPEGNVTQYDYDGRSNNLSVRHDGELEEGVSGSNIRLAETSCAYDELSRAIECNTDHFVTDTGVAIGDGFRTHTYVWTQDTRPTLYLDDSGDTTTFAYDTARRLDQVTDPLGNQVSYTYDLNSNVTRMTHLDLPTGVGGSSQIIDTHFEYDALDRTNATEDHVGNRATLSFDDRSNLLQATDALGNVVRCAYDGLSRRLACERDLTDTGLGTGTVVATLSKSATYDDSHRVVSRTDPNGNVTTYGYDALGRLTLRQIPDLTQLVYQWNAHHQLDQFTDANGSQVTYGYDRLNRVTGVNVLPGTGIVGTTSETWSYDGGGRVVAVQDDDTRDEMAYDSHSNVVIESTQVDLLTPLSTTSTYDNEGNLTQFNYPSGRRLTYTYDALNRVVAVTEPGRGPITTYEYLGARRERTKLFANNVRSETDWDLLRRVVSTRHATGGPAGSVLAHHTYLYDSMYNKTERQDQLPGGEFERFSYDSAYRMVESERGVPAGSSNSISYTLDVAGNRTLVAGGPSPGPYVLDASIPPGDAQVHQYSNTPLGPRLYDENGNLSSRTEATGTRTLFFDYRNRLVRTELSGTPIQEYVYDALGRRLASREGQAPPLALVSRWTYAISAHDDSRSAPIQHEEGGLNEYVHKLPGRGPLLQVRDTVGIDFFLHTDDLGSTVLITDVAGGVVERADYGDYGALSLVDGTGTPLAAPSTPNPYYFRGERLEEQTGLYYCLGGTYMDEATGRHLTATNPPSMARISGIPRNFANGNAWSIHLDATAPWLDLDSSLLDLKFLDEEEEEDDPFSNRGDEEEWD